MLFEESVSPSPYAADALQQSVYNTYDEQGRLIHQTVFQDNGNRIETSWDQSGVQPYWSVVAHFDPSGRLYNHDVVYDNGERTIDVYDINNSANFSHSLSVYANNGQKRYEITTNDDATKVEIFWDQYGSNPWWSVEKGYDSSQRLTWQRVVHDDAWVQIDTKTYYPSQFGFPSGIWHDTVMYESGGQVAGLWHSDDSDTQGNIQKLAKIWDFKGEQPFWYQETHVETWNGSEHQISQRDDASWVMATIEKQHSTFVAIEAPNVIPASSTSSLVEGSNDVTSSSASQVGSDHSELFMPPQLSPEDFLNNARSKASVEFSDIDAQASASSCDGDGGDVPEASPLGSLLGTVISTAGTALEFGPAAPLGKHLGAIGLAIEVLAAARNDDRGALYGMAISTPVAIAIGVAFPAWGASLITLGAVVLTTQTLAKAGEVYYNRNFR